MEHEMTKEEEDVNRAIGPLDFVTIERGSDRPILALLTAMGWQFVAMSANGGVLMFKVCGQC